MPAKTTKRSELKERRKEEILDVALEEFVQTGFSATRMEDIAARIGITKGTIFFHFDSKENLFGAVMRHAAAKRPAIHEKARAIQSDDPAADLKAIIRLLYTDVVTDPTYQAIMRLVISEAARFPRLTEFLSTEFGEPLARAMFKDAYERGVKSGQFKSLDYAIVADIVFGPALLKLLMHILDPATRDMEAYIAMHCDIIVDGISAR